MLDIPPAVEEVTSYIYIYIYLFYESIFTIELHVMIGGKRQMFISSLHFSPHLQ